MGKVIEAFKKKGGLKLIKQYFQNGTLLLGINQILVLGRSRTA